MNIKARPAWVVANMSKVLCVGNDGRMGIPVPEPDALRVSPQHEEDEEGDGPLHYVDFIHSRKQIEPVLQEVGRNLGDHDHNHDSDGGLEEGNRSEVCSRKVVILAAPGDVSGPSKDQAAAIFTCDAAQSLPRGLPTLPGSDTPSTTVHCGRL